MLCCKNPTFNTIYKLAIVPYIFVLEKALGIPNLLKLLHFYSADALVNTGLAKLGYEYVNIGMDCDLNPISYDASCTEQHLAEMLSISSFR